MVIIVLEAKDAVAAIVIDESGKSKSLILQNYQLNSQIIRYWKTKHNEASVRYHIR